jgi:outer membrane protein, multidrug efflux system
MAAGPRRFPIRRQGVVRRQGVALAILLLLGGCDVGPDLQPPAAAAPAHWTQSVDAAAWPSTQWWTGFGSPQLDAFMAQAEKANFDLAAAIDRIKEADAQARIAGAPLLPSVSLGGSATSQRELAGSSSKKATFPEYLLGPTASYELDFWGKNRASLEAAKQTALASRYDSQVVTLTIETSVANTVFQIAALSDEIKAAEDNLADGEKVLKGVLAEQQAGTAMLLDVVQQQTVVSNLKAAIPPLQQQLTQNVDALAVLLGETPEQLDLTPTSLTALAVPKVAPGLPSELLERRPDVQEAKAQLASASEDIKVAHAAFFPSVTLTAEGGIESTALSSLFTPAGLIYNLAASASQPIFEGGALRGELQLTKASYDELLQDYEKSVVSAFSDVESALIAMQKQREQLADQEDTVAKAQQAFQISQAQFQGGTVTLLTVLNTESTLFTAQNTLVQDRLSYMEAIVSLFQALGGGWQDTPIQANGSGQDTPVQASADKS